MEVNEVRERAGRSGIDRTGGTASSSPLVLVSSLSTLLRACVGRDLPG